ncbi:MAG TPA: 30S ribosomal protein S17 [Phycisphaerales bacterium]|nr:30S ribosomal protein S17 [Phycisphaerales bacterium]
MTDTQTKTNTRPRQTGVVASDARSKTRRVVVSFKSKHPKYGKYVRQRSVLQVHDEANESRVGDTVEVEECSPVSKTKTWRLVRVVARGAAESV